MHELSLAHKILETVRREAEKNGMRRVREVVVSHGGGAGYEPELVREAIGLLQADSLVSEAKITFTPGDGLDFRIERIIGE
ncbi:MAG: hydrogenase/urease maturation nickel metallochaperone HypA [Bacteroidota bacterium]